MPPVQDTKEMIASYVREEFFSGRLFRLSVDDIADSLGISKKTFYKHYRSKEALIYRVLDAVMAEIRENITTILNSDLDFIAKLNQFMIHLGRQVGHFGRLVQSDLRKHAPDLFKRIQAFRRERIHEVMGQLLAQGIKEGHVRPDINPRVFILAYLSAVENIVEPRVLSEESFSTSDVLHSLIAIFFHGILTEEASARLEQLQHEQPL